MATLDRDDLGYLFGLDFGRRDGRSQLQLSFGAGLFDGFSAFVKKAQDEAKQILELNSQDQGRNLQGKEIPDDQNKEESK